MDHEEEWRAVPGYEGSYEVSSIGRVRSIDREISGRWGPHIRHGRILQPDIDKDGYSKVRPCVNGKSRAVFVHRLVLMAFVGPQPDSRHVTLHRDGNPANNTVANLSWGTYSDNLFDAVSHGTHHQVRKTKCPAGHPYDAANTRMDGGSRKCRTCKRKRDSAARVNRTSTKEIA